MQRLFIVGTDTDCGKTYVTCQLVNYLKKQQQAVQAIKPVASGCVLQDSQWVSEDELEHAKVNETLPQLDKVWRLPEPVSPHIAADLENQTISLDALLKTCESPALEAFDYVLIEGAGGLIVPLNHEHTWIDFLVESKIPVILVVGMRLGCLNHALLTQEAMKKHGIHCMGWIANCIDKDMHVLAENLATLKQKMESPMLATVPYGGEMSVHSDAQVLPSLESSGVN